MSSSPTVSTFVMAGGAGSRLHPLTARRCKPALPFGASHRLVDFVLANLVHSGLDDIRLLVQYQPAALVNHVQAHWMHAAPAAQRLSVVKPAPDAPWRGTADAVHSCLQLLQHQRPDLIAVFCADHIYRMDVRQMIAFHIDRDADVTIATLPVPLAEARAYGVVVTDAAQRVQAFQEKPADPPAAPDHPGRALASMGNYIFSAGVLRRALERMQQSGGVDFGHDVLPALLHRHRVLAYDFRSNRLPQAGARATGSDGAYWRDIGTIEAYFVAHFDTLGAAPRFALHDPAWPVAPLAGSERRPPADVRGGEAYECRLGAGSLIDRARLHHVIAGPGVQVAPDAQLDECILMEGCRVGAGSRLRRVIVDAGVEIPPGQVIGVDAQQDRRHFHVSESGIVVVADGSIGNTAPSSRYELQPLA